MGASPMIPGDGVWLEGCDSGTPKNLRDMIIGCIQNAGLIVVVPEDGYRICGIDDYLAESLGYPVAEDASSQDKPSRDGGLPDESSRARQASPVANSQDGEPHGMVGVSLAALMHPDDTAGFLAAFAASADTSADASATTSADAPADASAGASASASNGAHCVCRIRRRNLSYGWFVLEDLSSICWESAGTATLGCIEITEVVKFQQELVAQNGNLTTVRLQLDAIIENTPGGVHVCRLFDGTHLDYASDGLCAMVGYTRDEIHELFDDRYAMLVYEEDRDGFGAAVCRLADYPHAEKLQYRMRRKDGTVFWVSDSIKSVRRLDGRMWAYAVVMDIDDEKQGLLRLRSLSDSIPGGVVAGHVSDGKLSIDFFNNGFCKLTGRSPEDCRALSNDEIRDFIAEEDLDMLGRRMSGLVSADSSFECEFGMVVGDSLRWIRMITSVIDKTAESISFTALLLDITASKENELKLAFQKLCVDKIDQALSAGTIINRLGIDKPMFYASYNMSKLLGYSTEEFMGMYRDCYRSIIYPDDFERVFTLNQRYGSELPSTFEMEFRFIRKDGSVIWVMERASRLDDFQGEHAYLSVFVDITGQKETLDMLRIREEEYHIAATRGNSIVCRYDIRAKAIDIPSEVADRYGFAAKLCGMPQGAIEAGYVASESIPEYLRLYESLGRGEDVKGIEVLHRVRDGFKWFRTIGTVIRDAAGEPVSAVIAFDDITHERQQAEEISALRENEQLLKIIAKRPKRVVVRYDIGRDTLVPLDDTSRAFIGGESLKDPLSFIIDSGVVMPESVDAVRAFARSVRRGDAEGSAECRMKDIEGDSRWFRVYFTNIFDDSGKALYAIVITEDVTEAHEKDIAYLRYQDLLKTEPGADVFRLEYDLTRDSYEGSEGKVPDQCLEDAPRTFSDHMRFIVGHCIVPAEADRFRGFMDRERLLNAFAAGTTQDSRELHVTLHGQEPIWMEMRYQMVRDPYSSDVKVLVTWQNIDTRKRDELETIRKTQIDFLTGAFNRATFIEKIKEKAQTADRSMLSALAILDVDGFKQVNDTFGHPYGDKILRDVAHTIRSVVFREDIVGRIGGDEFAICMSGFPDHAALEEKMRILNLAVSRDIEGKVRVTISIGVALCSFDAAEFEGLYGKADAALYQAKRLGGNRCVFYSEGMESESCSKMHTPIDPSGDSFGDADGDTDSGVYIRTFGYFDVFVRGNAIPFPREKSKELLAVLVDRRGGYVSPAEIISRLWEDAPVDKVTLTRCRKAAMYLKRTLEEYGIGGIIESKGGSRRIVSEKVGCDLFEYLARPERSSGLFKGFYMTSYAWGETTLASLQFRSGSDSGGR